MVTHLYAVYLIVYLGHESRFVCHGEIRSHSSIYLDRDTESLGATSLRIWVVRASLCVVEKFAVTPLRTCVMNDI